MIAITLLVIIIAKININIASNFDLMVFIF